MSTAYLVLVIDLGTRRIQCVEVFNEPSPATLSTRTVCVTIAQAEGRTYAEAHDALLDLYTTGWADLARLFPLKRSSAPRARLREGKNVPQR